MSAAIALASRPASPPARARELRRVILADRAGNRLGQVPLETGVAAARLPAPAAAAQLLVASGQNWSDRAATGDSLHVVIGRRACFGYIVDVDTVTWFSHPRLARADAFAALGDREARKFLYRLHSDDVDTVSEIIWETSGRISARRAPALPPGIDPRNLGSLERERDSAAYWNAIVLTLTGDALAHCEIDHRITGVRRRRAI